VLILIISLVLLLNRQYLEENISPSEYSITPANFLETKEKLKENDYISIEGTINPYQLILQKNQKNSIYYASLKEYDNFFVVQIPEGQVDYQQQIYKGRIKFLSNFEQWNLIQEEINKPLSIYQLLDEDLQLNLEEGDVSKINLATISDINENTFVLENIEEREFSNFILKTGLWILSISTLTFLIFAYRSKKSSSK
jgi:hypothetical protein